MDIRHYRGRVAGFLFCGFPAKFAGGFVERDNSSAIAPADIKQYRLAFQQWRAGDSEKAFRRAIFLFCIDSPKLFSIRQIPTAHNAFGTVGVDTSVRDRGSGARTFIKPKVVAVMRRIAAAPKA